MAGKIAFLFAGQGAQSPGMGQSICACSAAAKTVFEQAEAILPGLTELCFNGPKERLQSTENAQPALFTADYACAAALKEQGIIPQGAAGFSLGEWPALAFANGLDFSTAFRLVMRRGELMHKCAEEHPAAMAAVVRITPLQVEEVCRQFEKVYPVNYNAPGQTVVSLPKELLKDFAQAVLAAGGRSLPLAVSGGFHSPFMAQAAESFAREIEQAPGWQSPNFALYANITGRPYAQGKLKEGLGAQVKSPVLWQLTMENMLKDGYTAFIEVGPGNTLQKLLPQIQPGVLALGVADEAGLRSTVQALKERGYAAR